MRFFSVFEKDEEVLKAFSAIHLKGEWFDLDPTFSKGYFYKNINVPALISDKNPYYDFVNKDDATELKLVADNSIKSIVFDPPFLFRNRKSVNKDQISARFTYFNSYEELLKMYDLSLGCFYKKLKKNGFVFFKCQDMSDGKFFATHIEVVRMALAHNFVLKDIAIKVVKTKLQRDAKQQNCLAKTHSYWLVLQKRGIKTND